MPLSGQTSHWHLAHTLTKPPVGPLPAAALVLTPPTTQSAASYSPFTSYALSKLANTIMAAEYQRRFDRNSPCTYGHDTAVAIHPGIVATSLATTFFNQQGALALPGLQAVVQPVLSALYPLLLRTPQNSADSMMKAITAPRAQVAGRYMHNNRVARPARVRGGRWKGGRLQGV